MLSEQLFDGPRIIFDAIDPDKDAEIDSKWTHDPDYMRRLTPDPIRPLSTMQVKKKYEEWAKDAEKQHAFNFALRTKADARLIGLARVYDIMWTHGSGRVLLGIGAEADRGCGYGREALSMLLRYAFDELNLHRVGAIVPGDNLAALRFFQRAGFAVEVRRRQALLRDGQRFDVVMLGLLRDEWSREALS